MAEIIGNLSELLRQPESKEFHYKVTDGDLVKAEDGDSADLTLKLRFLRQRDYRSALAAAAVEGGNRKALTKAGIKGIMANEGATHVKICEITLLGWKMNVRAAHALGTEMDFSGQKPTAEIPYSLANRNLMAKHSNLAAQINAIMTDHDEWFETATEEEGEKNSVSGPSSSTGKSPAASASPAH